MKGGHRTNEAFQEVIELRESGWEGLPPPPVFAKGKPKTTGVDRKDPAVTSISETDAKYVSTLSRSSSISTFALSDFTVVESSDDEVVIDSTAITRHGTFYLEGGNVEVLCGDTLFRVHTSILSFHSPTLRRIFAQSRLATAESPNGCPRILSSDEATDFSTLLRMVYLPG
jgi:hypothetical protein